MKKYTFWKRISKIEAQRLANTVGYTNVRVKNIKDKTLKDWMYVGYFWISDCKEDDWIFEVELTRKLKLSKQRIWAVHFNSRQAARNACYHSNKEKIIKWPHKISAVNSTIS